MTVTAMKSPEDRPPGHLSAAAKQWWTSVATSYVLEPHHLRLLSEAASSWDRSQQARALVDAEGLTINDRFGQQKAHPAIAIERDSRILFARLMRELNLEEEEPDPARVPRLGRKS